MADQYEREKQPITVPDFKEPDDGDMGPPVREPIFNVPGAILVLLVLMVLVHVGRTLLSPGQDYAFVVNMAFIPARYLTGLLGDGLIGVSSLVTYAFLHGDITHLGINSIWMLAIGSAVAKRIGNGRFLLFSLVCSLFAAVAHLLTHWGEVAPVIGASGAISGYMAASIRFLFSAENSQEGARQLHADPCSIPLKSLSEVLRDGRVLTILAIWLVTNVIFGIGIISGPDENPIAWEAHIGGFIAGLLLFSYFDPPENGLVEDGACWLPPENEPENEEADVDPKEGGDQNNPSS